MSTRSRREFLGAIGSALVVAPLVQAQQTPAPDDLIADLVAGNRILAMENILDAMGHISVRNPSRPERFLLARSMPPELVTAADVLELDLDGNPVKAGSPASYLERFIHSEIYRARRDVNAIVHCHTPSLIPFADSDVPLRAMYHMAAFIADGVPVFDIRQAAGMTDLLVRDAKLGKALAASLGNKSVALMRHHGAVVVATSIPNVVGRSVYLDVNARVQIQTMAIGGKATYVDPAEAKLRMSDPNEYARAWDLWKRKVSR